MGGNIQIILVLCTVLIIAKIAGVCCTETNVVVCSQKLFKAKCEPLRYVYITSAWFGRKEGKCVSVFDKECGCDATQDLRNICAGHRNCTVEVLNKYFPCKNTCSRDFTRHLYVTYGCGAYGSHSAAANQQTWIIVGGVAGGVVFIFILVVVWRCCKENEYDDTGDRKSTEKLNPEKSGRGHEMKKMRHNSSPA